MNRTDEARWPAGLALIACIILYAVLPSRLVVGPKWLVPVLVGLPLLPLSVFRHRSDEENPWVRRLGIGLLGVVSLANVTSVVLLVERILDTSVTQGRQLIFSAVAIWVTNVVIYGVWFWEIDRGGPARRANGSTNYDLQFPQLENPSLAPAGWRPRFTDYLYTSFANGTSFAPADAMPLSRRAKVLFASESVISLLTISVVAARAVNILH